MNAQISVNSQACWPLPVSRSVGLFTDLRLYIDTLSIGEEQGEFSKFQLIELLTNRVKGLIFIDKLSGRVIDDLVRELIHFGWIAKNPGDAARFALTEKGKRVMRVHEADKRAYLRGLMEEMHRLYIIPGWFVNRLWELNPDGQGEIVVPAPLPSWNTVARRWENKKWDKELAEQAMESIRVIKIISRGAFPFDESDWLTAVENSWDRLSTVSPRTVAKSKKKDSLEKGKMETYAPRQRLLNAMNEAAVKLLFGNNNPITKQQDFDSDKLPLSYRNYVAWCPRLAELELIYYTDSHPQIPGRFIFPVSVFKKESNASSFTELKDITTPIGEKLFLHQPSAVEEKNLNNFLTILYNEYQRFYAKVKSQYVSIMDVRDAVCQQLRYSAELFDYFLERTWGEVKNGSSFQRQFTISLESDIREDQSGGYQQRRRPVILGGKLYSLIAMTKREH